MKETQVYDELPKYVKYLSNQGLQLIFDMICSFMTHERASFPYLDYVALLAFLGLWEWQQPDLYILKNSLIFAIASLIWVLLFVDWHRKGTKHPYLILSFALWSLIQALMPTIMY